ncbi:hypothetical protein EF294_03410 [Gordonia oryzae]|uniref:Uncharacterized protein n=1 Tax=Gordonia oryzae TaxID=2487349 RepID=A0A3N4GWJ6_9ACTN|nr:hypothetical protein [Gordonia oryzae]RPA65797.1 hypothetical protein EF294_03410 [Gordonia oryzae]
MSKKELKARVRELEIENATLRGELAAHRQQSWTAPFVGDVPPLPTVRPWVWCDVSASGGQIKHINDYSVSPMMNDADFMETALAASRIQRQTRHDLAKLTTELL